MERRVPKYLLKKGGSYRGAYEIQMLRSLYPFPDLLLEYYMSVYFTFCPSKKLLDFFDSLTRKLYLSLIENHKRRIFTILKYINTKNQDIILDIASNLGSFYWQVSKKAMCYALDLDKKIIAISKKIYTKLNYNRPFNYICMNAMHQGFRDNTFSIVIAADFFEHLNDGDKLLSAIEIRRILKKNGTLILNTDNLWRYRISLFLRRFLALIKLQNPFEQNFHFQDTHIGVTDPKSMRKILNKTGFKKCQLFYIHGRFPFEKLITRVPLINKILCSSFIIKAN
ncbi:class I SAM-dependent methyltransferase [candidate division KSB1 bacterium]|nr:class I SAM-dependent methyltransferase [candidate division KSB1 bacterium]